MGKYDPTARNLEREAQAAMALVQHMQSDDAELVHDMVEGETSLLEAITAALEEMRECEVVETGVAAVIDRLSKRRARVKARAAKLRGLIQQAMSVAEIPTLPLECETLTIKTLPPKAMVSDEASIPAKFWEAQPPKLDRAALLTALKTGEVPGATLSNGGETLQIRKT